MNIVRYIGRQFGNPTGFGGILSTWIMNRMNQGQYQAVLDSLDISNGDSVLDIGFGNGFFLNLIMRSKICNLYGIEISQDILALVRRRNKEAIVKGILHLGIGDVAELDFADGFFDSIYTINTVYFWNDIERGMSEIYRTLKPGGSFVNAFYSKKFLDRLQYTKYGFMKYTPDQIQQAAERVGFATVDMVELKQGTSYCLVMSKSNL